MRILVTGASSPLGLAFCQAARGVGIDVVLGVRAAHRSDGDCASSNVICLRLDEPESFNNVPRGLDAIVHIAAENTGTPEHLMAINGFGTQLLVDAAKRLGIEKIIHISSMSVYGAVTESVVGAETPIRHSTPYGLSKWAAECYLHDAWPDVKSVSVRSPAIIGTVSRRNFLAMLRDRMERREPSVELKNPDFLFNNVVHTDAFSEFLITLLRQRLEKFTAFPIGSSESIPLKDIVLEVARACAYAGEVKWASGKNHSFSIDSSSAECLGYKPWTVEKSLKHWLKK